MDYSLILILTCSGFDLETLGPPEWDIHEQGRDPDGSLVSDRPLCEYTLSGVIQVLAMSR